MGRWLLFVGFLSLASASPPNKRDNLPRFIAYINCLGGAETITEWEVANVNPFTHYILSFLSFDTSSTQIQTDPGEIWADDGGSTTNFTLAPSLLQMLQVAVNNDKKIILSLGGQVGSDTYLQWWSALSVAQMRAQIQDVVNRFEIQNNLPVHGIDVDIELGGWYNLNTDKYISIRDLIDAVPEHLLTAYVPQVGNGLCVPPTADDLVNGFPPNEVLGRQCNHTENAGGPPGWLLARYDEECVRSDGTPKLDWWGIQYYNSGSALCCGGGRAAEDEMKSTLQHYKNFANGWAAVGDIFDPSNPFYDWRTYPGPWSAYTGAKASRVILGKPGCQGCAGSNYLSFENTLTLLDRLRGQLDDHFGGVFFWDLCRLFEQGGPMCVRRTCPPSWGGDVAASPDALERLTQLKIAMGNVG